MPSKMKAKTWARRIDGYVGAGIKPQALQMWDEVCAIPKLKASVLAALWYRHALICWDRERDSK